MLEFIGVAVAAVGVYIAYLALKHQKESSRSQTETRNKETLSHPPAGSTHTFSKADESDNEPWAAVPDGITFGNQVVLVPGFQKRLFTHSGWTEEVLKEQEYRWVKRGEIIGRYHMKVPNSDADYFRHLAGTEHLSVDVRSPVSGLLLHPWHDYFVHWPKPSDPEIESSTMATFSILIPDDEPAPEDSDYVYGPALQFIEEHKGPLFRDSQRWTMGPMTEEEYSRLMELQKDAQCLVVDAMPRFKDYFEEARTKHPSLRPHIKHLV